MVNEMGRSPSRNFSISAVFSRAFGVMGGNPVTVFGVAFIFGTLPQLLLNIVLRGPMLAGAMQGATSMRGYWAASMLFWLASMLLTMIVIGALVRTTAAYADGRKIGFGEGVMAVLPKLLPLLGLSLLSIVGLAIGWMLLLVPGVILACMWAVNAPALVEEDVGVIGAFGRSRHLTKGVRWPIFGLFAVMLVIIWLATAAVGIVMVMGFGADREEHTSELQSH